MESTKKPIDKKPIDKNHASTFALIQNQTQSLCQNRYFHLIYRLVFCLFGFVMVAMSVGIFGGDGTSKNFYIYYTNLSNYLCFAFVMLCRGLGTETPPIIEIGRASCRQRVYVLV